MRYYAKTILGVFALVCLAFLAGALNETAAKTAAPPLEVEAVQVEEPDLPPAQTLLYEEPEPTVEPEPAIPIYDIPLSPELQEYTYNRCEALGLVAPGVDYQTVLALMSKESGYNTSLKKRLSEYAGKYPDECRLVDDDENGCLTFEIRKGRFSFKLNAPYSAERRKTASELAKKNIQNLQ